MTTAYLTTARGTGTWFAVSALRTLTRINFVQAESILNLHRGHGARRHYLYGGREDYSVVESLGRPTLVHDHVRPGDPSANWGMVLACPMTIITVRNPRLTAETTIRRRGVSALAEHADEWRFLGEMWSHLRDLFVLRVDWDDDDKLASNVKTITDGLHERTGAELNSLSHADWAREVPRVLNSSDPHGTSRGWYDGVSDALAKFLWTDPLVRKLLEDHEYERTET